MSEILERELRNAGVLLKGHFILASGGHSDTFINKDTINTIPSLFRRVVMHLADRSLMIGADVVTGPAVAGAVISSPVAFLTNRILVYPEKTKSLKMEFRRGYDKVIEGKRVIIIEDIITTAGSVIKTAKSIIDNGGEVAGVVAIWNRGGVTAAEIEKEIGAKIVLTALIEKTVMSWGKDDCPICKTEKKTNPLTNPKTGEKVDLAA